VELEIIMAAVQALRGRRLLSEVTLLLAAVAVGTQGEHLQQLAVVEEAVAVF
jgi:hypothetical protein